MGVCPLFTPKTIFIRALVFFSNARNKEKDMINSEWKQWLHKEMCSEYFYELEKKIILLSRTIELSPLKEKWYNSLTIPDYSTINVFLIGNRPYLESYASDGFSFSSYDDTIDIETYYLYQQIYNELGIIYDQTDNTKTKWLKQGVLCFPIELTCYSGVKKYCKRIWEPFITQVINFWVQDKQPKIFCFLDKYTTTQYINFLKNNHPQHTFIHYDIENCRFTKTKIFSTINDFTRNNYNYLIDWK